MDNEKSHIDTRKNSGLTKIERAILYSLGQSYKSFNKLFTDKPLAMSISKVIFIDILISSKSVEKKSRAIYKNVESLEHKKYVKYSKQELSFTKKGLKEFLAMDKEISEYFDLKAHLNDPKTIKLHHNLQTRLRH